MGMDLDLAEGDQGHDRKEDRPASQVLFASNAENPICRLS